MTTKNELLLKLYLKNYDLEINRFDNFTKNSNFLLIINLILFFLIDKIFILNIFFWNIYLILNIFSLFFNFKLIINNQKMVLTTNNQTDLFIKNNLDIDFIYSQIIEKINECNKKNYKTNTEKSKYKNICIYLIYILILFQILVFFKGY